MRTLPFGPELRGENKGTIPVLRRVRGPFRMSNTRKRQVFAVTLLFVFAWHTRSLAQSGPSAKTQVVMLGTGTPLPDPDRSGPSTAIVVNGTAYIVDAGTRVVRHAAAARERGERSGTNRPQNRVSHSPACRSHTRPSRPDSHALDHGQKGAAGAVWSRGNTRDGETHFAGLRRRHKGTH